MRYFLVFTALLGLATSGFAHRLDEYLQATTIVIKRDRVSLRMQLTPGQDVAAGVLAAIDVDRNGVLSPSEQQAYAAQVAKDLSFAVNGHAQPLRLVSASFPEAAAMRQGEGSVLLAFDAPLPAGGALRRLDFSNRHRHADAVYLVNTLQPDDPAIAVLGQQRSHDQSSYRVDFR
jgi:hypothetical protein